MVALVIEDFHPGCRALLLKLLLPTIEAEMGRAKIGDVHAAVGDALRARAKLFDFVVGLDAASAHDCPTVTRYRLTVSEKAWLRQIDIVPDQFVAAGTCVALLSTEEDEPINGPAQRAARTSIAAILEPTVW